MSITATITDNSSAVLPRYERAATAGLVAAGARYKAELRKAHGSRYYKGGAFRSTLQVVQHIQVGPVAKTNTGLAVSIGIPKGIRGKDAGPTPADVGMVALYWEMGHQNLYTRRFERFRVWVPTAERYASVLGRVFAQIVARVMGAT